MQTMHPTLLIGPADWDAARMPRAEYEARIATLFADTRADGAIVFGNAADHAALAYLAAFTPKLDEGMALIPREGEPRLLVRGSVNMIDAARPLTWLTQLSPLRDAGKVVADFARRLPGRVVLIGGEIMPFAMRREIDAALGGAGVEDATRALQARMLVKSPRELALLREACAGLAVAAKALPEGLLVAEHAAHRWGAQDVRSLFSLDNGRSFAPFTGPAARKPDAAYFAVRHAGYWADGFVSAAPNSLHERARAILRAMIGAAKAGTPSRALAEIAAGAREALALHPMCAASFGNSIGLALQEPPLLTPESDAALVAGAVHSLRAGVRDEASGAIASAIVLVTDSGNEVLWETPA